MGKYVCTNVQDITRELNNGKLCQQKEREKNIFFFSAKFRGHRNLEDKNQKLSLEKKHTGVNLKFTFFSFISFIKIPF